MSVLCLSGYICNKLFISFYVEYFTFKYKKFYKFCILKKMYDLNVIAISEAWHYENEIGYFDLNDNKARHLCRNGQGGGIALYMRMIVIYNILERVHTRELY